MTDEVETTMPPDDLTLVALTPADMAPAQADLVAWCDRKIAAVKAERDDIETNLELATEHGWKHKSVAASLARAEKRILYYEKMKAAVAAGYLIVPNFPIDVFAVRVARPKQPEQVRDSTWGGFPAKAELLPVGVGRYVDDMVFHRDESHVETVDGKERLVKRYVTTDYDEVDFPVVAVKPAILKATQRAMALRIFDQIGTVQNRTGRDPIVVGRLLDPRGNGRCATFFIAWWLDTASL
ncbi:MAG TPA: hypothetical protein VEU08_19990 [Vicinamibacterales bacterium]|nr:hypothetical protein [Vicinamibacterales bacterium]